MDRSDWSMTWDRYLYIDGYREVYFGAAFFTPNGKKSIEIRCDKGELDLNPLSDCCAATPMYRRQVKDDKFFHPRPIVCSKCQILFTFVGGTVKGKDNGFKGLHVMSNEEIAVALGMSPYEALLFEQDLTEMFEPLIKFATRPYWNPEWTGEYVPWSHILRDRVDLPPKGYYRQKVRQSKSSKKKKQQKG